MDKVQFKIPIIFLDIIGLHPQSKTLFSIAREYVTILLYIIVQVSSFAELFTNLNNQDVVVKFIQAVFAGVQNAFKMAVVMWYRDDIGQLITNTKHFFPLDHFGQTQGDKLRHQHKLFKLFYHSTVALMSSVILMYACTSIFKQEPAILSYGQTSGLTPLYQKLYTLLDLTHMTSVTSVICGFDGVFFYLIAHVVTEFKLIKTGFDDGRNHYRDKLNNIIKHHVFILEYS